MAPLSNQLKAFESLFLGSVDCDWSQPSRGVCRLQNSALYVNQSSGERYKLRQPDACQGSAKLHIILVMLWVCKPPRLAAFDANTSSRCQYCVAENQYGVAYGLGPSSESQESSSRLFNNLKDPDTLLECKLKVGLSLLGSRVARTRIVTTHTIVGEAVPSYGSTVAPSCFAAMPQCEPPDNS